MVDADSSDLDQVDRLIVAALQVDGRRSYTSLAAEIGVGESVVRYRVQRMQREGILQIVGIADPLKIGFDLMSLITMRTDPGRADDVAAEIVKFPEVSYLAAIAGTYDLHVEVVCRDTAHFNELLNQRIQRIEGVRTTHSSLILSIHKMAYGWGVGRAGVPTADPQSE
jgi:Lrp/AsnC family transcriptional regulator for asnA, asnC and gidA